MSTKLGYVKTGSGHQKEAWIGNDGCVWVKNHNQMFSQWDKVNEAQPTSEATALEMAQKYAKAKL